ncbi:hypothetical protein EIK76_01090 [Rheinheimera mesophila]|uniref:Uncharacterized protein n=1 Tax=Rheinheimera mesophila TaxID=1547515 RepID=A0A3P3QNA8_9GAMM|nr:dienelactone hydrolase family protein [Rheinheimera mesophila]RRJ22711.1 hypothetical protein EIK76_01090 [Rheinheimera mesophila]
MQLLIVTDIFGTQPEMLRQFDLLTLEYGCLQPYDHQPPVFVDDAEAYQYFLAHGGFEAYCNKLADLLQMLSQPVFLLGFSAGAAACWANLVTEDLPIKHCLGFYGGQIRHLTELQPLYPTELIFAEETHFSVPELMQKLSDKPYLKQNLVSYPHGFMNPLSQGYRPEAAAQFWQKIKAGYLSGLETLTLT